MMINGEEGVLIVCDICIPQISSYIYQLSNIFMFIALFFAFLYFLQALSDTLRRFWAFYDDQQRILISMTCDNYVPLDYISYLEIVQHYIFLASFIVPFYLFWF